MGEVLLWRKYSSDEGVFHDVNGNLKAGVVDSEGAAGITQSLVDKKRLKVVIPDLFKR